MPHSANGSNSTNASKRSASINPPARNTSARVMVENITIVESVAR